jgi:hypothetical protein
VGRGRLATILEVGGSEGTAEAVTTQEEIEERIGRELAPFVGLENTRIVRGDMQCTIARVLLELLPRPRVERILIEFKSGKAVAELSIPPWFFDQFLR